MRFHISTVIPPPSFGFVSHCTSLWENRQTKHQYALAWGLPMAYDTVVLILGAVKLTNIWRAGGRSRLVQILFRDQIVWYSIMTVVSILNLVVAYAMPPPPGSETRGVVSSVLVTLTSISVRSGRCLSSNGCIADVRGFCVTLCARDRPVGSY